MAWGRDFTSGGVERGTVRARRTVCPAEWRVLRYGAGLPIEATRRRVGGGIFGEVGRVRACASNGGILAGLDCGEDSFCLRCFGDCCGCEGGSSGEAAIAEGIFLPGGARLKGRFWDDGYTGLPNF